MFYYHLSLLLAPVTLYQLIKHVLKIYFRLLGVWMPLTLCRHFSKQASDSDYVMFVWIFSFLLLNVYFVSYFKDKYFCILFP